MIPTRASLVRIALLTGLAPLALLAQPASAQGYSAVSACTGASLPRSAVTDILSPVLTGIVTPIENVVNPITDVVAIIPLVGRALPGLDINLAGLLASAAAGDPITLGVLATDGSLIGPDGRCLSAADGFTLRDPAGLAIGGNRIAGLGTGAAAQAAEGDAVAIGDGARTLSGATGALALGAGAEADAANSVALGAGSQAGRGGLSTYAAAALPGTFSSAGEVAVGAAGAERQITHVAPGSAATDAVNVAQLLAVRDLVTLLADDAVVYSSPDRGRIVLAGVGGTRVTNLAAGAVSATSTDAVTGAQLHAVDQAIANLTLRIDTAGPQPLRYSDAAAPETPNQGQPTNNVALVGAAAGPVGLHNVADGRLAEGSADAVTGNQLHATNRAVTALGDIVAGQGERIDALEARIDGQGAAIADNRAAVADLEARVANGAIGPVQYSDAATPEVPNGGVPSNNLALVGAAPGPVGLHNVADGRIAEGSTDAVNGGQLFALGQATAHALLYDTDALGARSNSVTLTGGDAAAPVRIANLAVGALHAESAEAVNGAQLHATNQAVDEAQATATQALALGVNSVQYDAGRASVTFGDRAGPVRLGNVAAGLAPTDAVNRAQLDGAMGTTLLQAQSYTDLRIAELHVDLRSFRREAHAGTAGALALAGLPQPYEPGRSMVAMGVGTYQGEQAMALGAATALDNGQTILRLGASFDTRGRTGANAAIGWQF